MNIDRPFQDASNNRVLRRDVRAAVKKAERALKAAYDATNAANALVAVYWSERNTHHMPPASWLSSQLLATASVAANQAHTLLLTMEARLPPFPPTTGKKKP